MLDTHGDEVFIGRYFEERPEGVVLMDVDYHSEGADGRSKDDFVRNAAKYGQWKKLATKTVPAPQVASIRTPAPWAAIFGLSAL